MYRLLELTIVRAIRIFRQSATLLKDNGCFESKFHQEMKQKV